MKAFHALVLGEVQGVGFRYSATWRAKSLGITGWVRNLDDGSVEIWAEGGEEDLKEFVAWLREGPSGSWVRDLTLDWESPKNIYSSFGIAY